MSKFEFKPEDFAKDDDVCHPLFEHAHIAAEIANAKLAEWQNELEAEHQAKLIRKEEVK